MTKVFGLCFKLSFIGYVFSFCTFATAYYSFWFDFSYRTLEILINASFYLPILFFIYQLVYIFLLSKKAGVSIKKSIADFFLYLCFSFQVFFIIFHAYIFFNGYIVSEYNWFNNNPGTYYGFAAWRNLTVELVLFVPAVVLCVIYQLCYFNYLKRSKL